MPQPTAPEAYSGMADSNHDALTSAESEGARSHILGFRAQFPRHTKMGVGENSHTCTPTHAHTYTVQSPCSAWLSQYYVICPLFPQGSTQRYNQPSQLLVWAPHGTGSGHRAMSVALLSISLQAETESKDISLSSHQDSSDRGQSHRLSPLPPTATLSPASCLISIM